jgi:hypothetical protein
VTDFWRPTPRSRDEQARERRQIEWQWSSPEPSDEGWTHGFVGSLLVFAFIAAMCAAAWIASQPT